MLITIHNKQKFTDKELNHIELVTSTKEFENMVLELREKLEIPPNGLDMSTKLDLKVKEERERVKNYYQEAEKHAIKFLRTIPCSSRWTHTFMTLILFNIAYPPSSNISVTVVRGEITIKVSEYMNMTELKKALTENTHQKSIEEMMSTLPKLLKANKSHKAIFWDKLIIEANDAGHTYASIADKIDEVYGEEVVGTTLTYSNLNGRANRFRKHVKELDSEIIIHKIAAMIVDGQDRTP